MENKLQIFTNEQFGKLLAVEINGEIHFVAADACKILDVGDTSNAVKTLDDDEKGTYIISPPGGEQRMLVVNEAGLYRLIFKSRKPDAKKFQRWVYHEVLPSIRKHGTYMTPSTLDEIAGNPDLLMKEAQDLKAEREKINALSARRHHITGKGQIYFIDKLLKGIL